MTKKEYSELLQSPSWKLKRDYILIRDGHKCTKCGATENLQVHHKYYVEGNLPWGYPDSCLITLCGFHHLEEHRKKPISSFVRQPKKSTKKKTKRELKKEKEKVEMHMGYPKTKIYPERRKERMAIVNQLLMDIELRKLQRMR